MHAQIWINFTYSAACLAAALLLLWLISLKLKDASIIDIFWGAGFALVGALCLSLAPARTAYIWLLGLLPIIWGLRLTIYLARRNLGHGEDYRYQAMQRRAAKKGMNEMSWRRRAFFTVFLGQGILILIISAPVWVGTASAGQTEIGSLATAGALIWLTGFLFEAIGDAQLAAFIRKHKSYDGPYEDKPVMDSGLWRYTRHPNYFGNSLIWWGIWLVSAQTPWSYATIISPIIMTVLLVRISGKDLLERKMARRPAYQSYMARTSGFIPRLPKS